MCHFITIIFARVDFFLLLGKSKPLMNRIKTMVLYYFSSIYYWYKSVFVALVPGYALSHTHS